jgi:PAS domain S-box-containing protein
MGLQPNLKFSQQILLFLSLPVVFQIVFVCLLTSNLAELVDCNKKEAAVTDVMMAANNFFANIASGAGSQILYKKTGEELDKKAFAGTLSAFSEEELRLRDMLQSRPSTARQVKPFEEMLLSLKEAFKKGIKALDSQDRIDEAVAFLQIRRSLNRADSLVHDLRRVLGEERQDIANRQKAVLERIYATIVAGLAFNLSMTVIFVLIFERKTARGFARLTDNIIALGAGRKLSGRVEGQYELAALDKVLHQVSDNLAEARLKEKSIVENADDMICSLDQSLRFVLTNPACSRVFKMGVDDLRGRSLLTLLRAKDADRAAQLFNRIIESEGKGSFELSLVGQEGNITETQWNVIWSAEKQNLFCVAHDISQRKHLERLRSDFVAMISHDLRSPLTSLQLTLNVLASSAGELSDKNISRIKRAEDSTGELVSMVNELLEVEKLESGVFELNLENIESIALVHRAIGLLADSAQAKELIMTVHTPGSKSAGLSPVIAVDKDRVVRVLTNLLANAIKFAPVGSKIKTTVFADGPSVYFEVTDQGPGIEPANLALVFERFRQVKDASGATSQGSGLGLAICKAVAEAHGGEVGVRSEVGKGSTFWLKLPAAGKGKSNASA